MRRVPGYFVLAADSHIDTLSPSMTNVSHKIKFLTFNDEEPMKHLDSVVNYSNKLGNHLTAKVAANLQYLIGRQFSTNKTHQAPQHFMKVIKTKLDNEVVVYQTALQTHLMDVDERDIPEARFSYDFSPIAIRFDTSGKTFYEFLTSVFAIVGGTFTFISLIHKFVDTVDQRFKRRINKLG